MSSARPVRLINALSAGSAAAGAAGAASAAGVATLGSTADTRFAISSSERPLNGSKFEDEVMTGSPRLGWCVDRPVGVRRTKAAGTAMGARVPLGRSLMLTLVVDHMYNTLYNWSI